MSRCDLDPSRVAVWWSQEYLLKLSAFAASVLSDAKVLSLDKLAAHRRCLIEIPHKCSIDLTGTKEYDTRKKVSDPVTGTITGPQKDFHLTFSFPC